MCVKNAGKSPGSASAPARARHEEAVKDRARNARRLAARPVAWVIDDDAEDWEEGRAELVYAHDEAQARALAAPYLCVRYTDGPYPKPKELNVRRAPRADRFADSPRVEDRKIEAQRLAGLRWDGYDVCESCGLAEPDSPRARPEWRICFECLQCGECGHDGDCPESPEPRRRPEPLDDDQHECDICGEEAPCLCLTDPDEEEPDCKGCGTCDDCVELTMAHMEEGERLELELLERMAEAEQARHDAEQASCICVWNDLEGKSVCGVPCPVHSPRSAK